MVQQGQVFELTRRGRDGERLWAFATGSAVAARSAFNVAVSPPSRTRVTGSSASSSGFDGSDRIARRLTLAELVEIYLAQHDVQPVTIEERPLPARQGNRDVR
jgi:hypothetical protein